MAIKVSNTTVINNSFGIENIKNAQFYSYTLPSNQSQALNPAAGLYQSITLIGPTTFTESMADGDQIALMIDATTYAITWPTVSWVSDFGNSPNISTQDTTHIVFWKQNSTLFGARVGAA